MLPHLTATRIRAAEHRGSSSPVWVDTPAGRYLTKLHGAAQGPLALVAEIIVAELAQVLGLRVPARALVTLNAQVACDDRDPELADLIRASSGVNLGFRPLDGARDFRPDDRTEVDEATASQIVWLDALVMNHDRTSRNPNLLWSGNALWLIDHGAALSFHHDWTAVTEDAPRQPLRPAAPHVLADRGTSVAAWDLVLATQLTREVLVGAVAAVPDALLAPTLGAPPPGALLRRRHAYVAFLWKRLKAPRPFAGLEPGRRAG